MKGIKKSMSSFLHVNWHTLFYPQIPVIEIVIRGTIIYLSLFIMLRYISKREAGTLGISDLLVIVLLADAAQNSMAGQYNSITDGLILVLTIVTWSVLLNYLSFQFPKIRKIIRPPKLLLVKDGKLIWKNMSRELLSKDEIMSELRVQGVDNLHNVKEAFMESDGSISVITNKKRIRQNVAPKKRKSM